MDLVSPKKREETHLPSTYRYRLMVSKFTNLKKKLKQFWQLSDKDSVRAIIVEAISVLERVNREEAGDY